MRVGPELPCAGSKIGTIPSTPEDAARAAGITIIQRCPNDYLDILKAVGLIRDPLCDWATEADGRVLRSTRKGAREQRTSTELVSAARARQIIHDHLIDHWTMKDLAKTSGVSRETLTGIRAGRIERTTLSVHQRLTALTAQVTDGT
jgi:hypothetical protein